MEEKRSYIYRHTRLDTNEVFYIGKGTTPKKYINSNNVLLKFSRAYQKNGRNKFWLNIINKTN